MQFTIRSHSDPALSYTVTLPEDSATDPHCTCKGYGYRRMCSHITEAIKQLEAQVQAIQAARALPQLDGTLDGIRICSTCGEVELVGTHARLDQCARCYRQATFSWTRPRTPVRQGIRK